MTKMRTCICCKEKKDENADNFFYRNKSRGWFSSWCKSCRKTMREKTKSQELLSQRIRRGKKPCASCGSTEKNGGKIYCRSCQKKRVSIKKMADKCLYKARLRKATPPWSDKMAIRSFYKNKPEGYHVDHIIPIRGICVCGLHVVENLQYLPAHENMCKGNKFSLEHNGVM